LASGKERRLTVSTRPNPAQFTCQANLASGEAAFLLQ
jgi:hypothetical protein